jgi:hypothetical protein
MKETNNKLSKIKKVMMEDSVKHFNDKKIKKSELPVFRDEILKRCKANHSFINYKKDYRFIHEK